MIQARLMADGTLYGGGEDGANVRVKRVFGPPADRGPVTVCADSCRAVHPDGARCVIPHAALIAAREQAKARAAKIDAEVRRMAEAALVERGEIEAAPDPEESAPDAR